MKLSEAIRRGCALVVDSKQYMPNSDEWLNGCALCAAWIGAGRTVGEYWEERIRCGDPIKVFSDGLGIPLEMVNQIDLAHCRGDTREQIADWVEREYESKQPQKQRESDADYTKRILANIVAQPLVEVDE